jgi:hypothetical protein
MNFDKQRLAATWRNFHQLWRWLSR